MKYGAKCAPKVVNVPVKTPLPITDRGVPGVVVPIPKAPVEVKVEVAVAPK